MSHTITVLEVVVTTEGGHGDHLKGGQWLQSSQHDCISVLVIILILHIISHGGVPAVDRY